MTKHLAAGIALGVVGTVAIVMAIWLGVVYTGSYNVAASEQHADVVRWTFDTTRHRSVAKQAGDVELPRDPSRDLVAKGAGHYAETCVHCHGAPGQDPEPWSRGMRPEPPDLAEAATEWTPAEIHWIVANGIKMTGMPAMGGHHSHEDIVALTAFVEALPGLTAEDYRGLTGSLSSNTGREPSARQRPEHSHAQGGDRSQLY